jgi:histidine triad (HIT) family protein
VAPASEDCRFCQIVARALPAAIAFEDELTMAFLDSHPLFFGHALLVPKIHYETLPDLPPYLLAPLFGNAQLLVRAVQEALTADGSFIAINNTVSQSVPHLHVHVVPRRFKDGLKGFFWPRQLYPSPEDMEATARAIGDAFTRLRS